MAPRQNALMTADEYQALPEGGPRFELIQGEVRMAPAPNLYHQRVSGNIQFQLRQHLEQTAAGELYVAPVDVYLSEHDVVQPDLVFVAAARLSILAREGIRGAPTLLIEILSPSTRTLDCETKKRLYQSSGVEELWLVDPDNKSVEIYRLQEEVAHPSRVLGEQEQLDSVCFPGLQLRCADFFK